MTAPTLNLPWRGAFWPNFLSLNTRSLVRWGHPPWTKQKFRIKVPPRVITTVKLLENIDAFQSGLEWIVNHLIPSAALRCEDVNNNKEKTRPSAVTKEARGARWWRGFMMKTPQEDQQVKQVHTAALVVCTSSALPQSFSAVFLMVPTVTWGSSVTHLRCTRY